MAPELAPLDIRAVVAQCAWDPERAPPDRGQAQHLDRFRTPRVLRFPHHALPELGRPRHPAANGYPVQLAASEATVISIVDEDRAQAIRFSACSRSSTAWKAAAWVFEA
jgi:hypothetical protein